MRATRRLRTVLAAIGGAAVLAAVLAGCNQPNSNNTEHSEANAGINQILANQPVPIFDSSQQRADMIEAEAIMALGTATTSFFFPEGSVVDGKVDAPPIKVCPSEGEPIPNTSSLTNPEQQTSGGSATVGQMDPDGVYSPSDSSGTYVVCLTRGGQPWLEYWEGDVMTVSAAALWNTGTHQVQVTGAPTAAIAGVPAARGK